VEVADRLGGEKANIGGIVSVLVGEVKCLFFPVEFDDTDPLIHFCLGVSIGALSLNSELLSERKRLHFLGRSCDKLLGGFADLCMGGLGVVEGGKEIL